MTPGCLFCGVPCRGWTCDGCNPLPRALCAIIDEAILARREQDYKAIQQHTKEG